MPIEVDVIHRHSARRPGGVSVAVYRVPEHPHYTRESVVSRSSDDCKTSAENARSAATAVLRFMEQRVHEAQRELDEARRQLESVTAIDPEARVDSCVGTHDDGVADGNLARCTVASGCGRPGCLYNRLAP